MRKLLLFSIVLFLSACSDQNELKLNIAAAANVRFALEEIVASFESETGISSNIISGSSGKLTAQIKEGAAYDIFISADLKYPQFLKSEQLAIGNTKIYALGKLVLWSASARKAIAIDQLSNESIRHIALANPKTAPYGLAGEQALVASNMKDVITDKLVFGESISQTNQFIISGAADIGFTALSVVKSPQLSNVGQYSIVNDTLYDEIRQGVISLKNGKASQDDKTAFIDFLVSDKARKILSNYGYQFPDE